MAHEKLFTAKQAAEAVLAKAADLAKSFKPEMKAAPSTDKSAPSEKPQDSADGVKASPNPARAQPNEAGNPAPGALPQNTEKFATEKKNNGHLKLAMFVGRMAEKRKHSAPAIGAPAPTAAPQAPAAPGLVKAEHGVARDAGAPLHRKANYDKSGDKVSSQIAAEGAKDNHVKKLAEIKATPKPKLPG